VYRPALRLTQHQPLRRCAPRPARPRDEDGRSGTFHGAFKETEKLILKNTFFQAILSAVTP